MISVTFERTSILETLLESCSGRSEYITLFGIWFMESVVMRWRGMRRQIVLSPVLKMSRTSCGDTGTFGDCSGAALVDVGVTSNVVDVVWSTFVDVDSEYKPCGSGVSGNFTDVDA